MISLRMCEFSDLNEIFRLEKLCFKQPYNKSTFKYLFDILPEGFIVAEEEGRLCGYIIFSVISGSGIIISFTVHPEKRRKNYGTYILRYALKKLEKKTDEVRLQVRISNHKAISFYHKNGFISDSTVKEYYPDSEDALVMKKSLNRQ